MWRGKAYKKFMSSHFKWYPSEDEAIVPWNARYSFPSQANSATKMTPRLPPKNGATFIPGEPMRLEFPAQGYVNMLNTTLEFDVTLCGYGTPAGEITRFQNNIQSIFSRVRLLYGATPLEDIPHYNVIMRGLTEWTCTNQNGTLDQTSITDGIGGVIVGSSSDGAVGLVNVRQNYIQGVSSTLATANVAFTAGDGSAAVPNRQNAVTGFTVPTGAFYCTRRYSVSLGLGMFIQDKLVPTKFMASALALEITLENAQSCIFSLPASGTGGTPPTYAVGNVNLIPEILVFDASYDAMFLKGLQDGGVPIKFSSWHTFFFSTQKASTMMLNIQERSRSVKAIFAVQRRSPSTFNTDSHAFLYDSSVIDNLNGNSMQNYQFRIGGRYFPAAPVQLSITPGSGVPNGGAEAFSELQKSLNIVGDYRLSSSVNTLRWAVPVSTTTVLGTTQPELDYSTSIIDFNSLGNPVVTPVSAPHLTLGNIFAGNQGSCCFAMSTNLETSNGVEISGLNAEEQNDIALNIQWRNPQSDTNVIEAYVFYDAMIVLKENNVLELIQ